MTTSPDTSPEEVQVNTELPPTESPQQPKSSLAIALVVSVVFLLVAAGVAVWLWQSKKVSDPAQQQAQQSIKKVSWQAPAEIPAVYQAQQNITDQADAVFYTDNAAGCSLTTTVTSRQGKTAEELLAQASEQAKQMGVTMVKTEQGQALAVKDSEGGEQSFTAVSSEQDVNIQGVDFKKQFAVTAHQTFGEYVATIGWACKSDTWESKKTELEQFAKQFTLKVER